MLKYLLFDLDNTLYSCHNGLEDGVARRIRKFAADFLGTTPDDAWRQRLEVVNRYGTCLEWLIMEKGLRDIEAYLAAAHPPDEADCLLPDPGLRAFLEGIPIPKAIITNAPQEHADLVLGKLELGGIFTHVFEVRQCNFLGKPRREYFEYALNTLGISASEALFVDDFPIYVQGFAAIGGKGVLLDERGIYGDTALPRIRALKEITKYIASS